MPKHRSSTVEEEVRFPFSQSSNKPLGYFQHGVRETNCLLGAYRRGLENHHPKHWNAYCSRVPRWTPIPHLRVCRICLSSVLHESTRFFLISTFCLLYSPPPKSTVFLMIVQHALAYSGIRLLQYPSQPPKDSICKWLYVHHSVLVDHSFESPSSQECQ